MADFISHILLLSKSDLGHFYYGMLWILKVCLNNIRLSNEANCKCKFSFCLSSFIFTYGLNVIQSAEYSITVFSIFHWRYHLSLFHISFLYLEGRKKMVSGLLLVMKWTSPLLCALMLKYLLMLLVLGFNSMDPLLANELRVGFTCLVNIHHLCFLERKNLSLTNICYFSESTLTF